MRGRSTIHTYVQCRTSDASIMQMYSHPNPNACVNNVIYIVHVLSVPTLYLPTNCQNLIAAYATIISGSITN